MPLRFTVALCVLLLAVGGCGDSGEDAEGSDATVLAETTAVATEPPSEGGDGQEAAPEHCPELVMALSSAANAAAAQVGGTPLDLPAANMRAIADRVPEIRDELLTLADAYDAFLRALDDVGVDFSDPASMANLDDAAMEELEAASAALDSEAVRTAEDRIQEFFERECS